MQPPRQHEVGLVITRILRPLPRPTARRAAVPAPPVPLRFTAARLAAHPPPQRSSAPRPAAPATFLRPCLRPPKNRRRDALGIALRVRRSCRRHRRLARPPPGATASSAVLVTPGASAFVPHLCSLVIPAGSLDPAPCGGKEHLSVLRSQNPVCTGFAKHLQSQGRGITANPSGLPAAASAKAGAGRSRLGKHGASRHLLAASGVASKRREHQPQPSPALGRSGAGCRKIAHPAPHGPTLDQKSQAAKRKKRQSHQ
jgi:hypothetical protein